MSDATPRPDEDTLPLATAAASAEAHVGGRRGRFDRIATWLAHPPLALTLLVCAAILVARKPDAVLHPQLWAEDGIVFYRDGLVDGWSAVTKPYADYLHFIPRATAAIARLLDPAIVPAFFVIVALGLTVYVAVLTQSRRLPFRSHVGFALAVVLVPDSAETLLNLCNLQWVIAAGLVLIAILRDGTNRLERWHDYIAAAVLGLTGPFSVVLGPIYWWRAWSRRTAVSWWLAAVVTFCAAVQAWVILHAGGLEHGGSSPVLTVPRVIGMRVLASLFAGALVPFDYRPAVEVCLGVVAVAGVLWLGLKRGEARIERLWVAASFLVLTAAAIYRVKHVLIAMCNTGNASRYFYLPQLLFYWLVLAAISDRRRAVRLLATVVALWVAVINLPRVFNYLPVPDEHWEKYVPRLRTGEAVDVPIAPAGWTMRVPARQVRAPASPR